MQDVPVQMLLHATIGKMYTILGSSPELTTHRSTGEKYLSIFSPKQFIYTGSVTTNLSDVSEIFFLIHMKLLCTCITCTIYSTVFASAFLILMSASADGGRTRDEWIASISFFYHSIISLLPSVAVFLNYSFKGQPCWSLQRALTLESLYPEDLVVSKLLMDSELAVSLPKEISKIQSRIGV